MIAWLQQFTTVSLIVLAASWLWVWHDRSLLFAALGAAGILSIHAPILAAEFGLLAFANRHDPARQADAFELARAWWGEVKTTPPVFCWRQPFFQNEVPDYLPITQKNKQGVLLIHGLFCNRGFWTPWLKRLLREDRPFIAVSLEPVLANIEEYVPTIEAAIKKLELNTGIPPVLICHSMGGLAARAWLAAASNNEARVAHVITIGSPHQGTWMGRFSRSESGHQMRLQSSWIERIALSEKPTRRALFTCWYSNCDNIVFPASTATLAGADNRFVPGVAHVAMAFSPEVVDHAFMKIASL